MQTAKTENNDQTKLVSKKKLPSNDCLNLIFQFFFDKKQATHLPLKRLSRNSNQFYSKEYNLSHFSRPKKKVIINHNTDH